MHGVAEELISNNGSQYSSFKFKRFQKDRKFCHETSSPGIHPKSNGLAESTVKTVKKLVKKCSRSGQDIKKGLLILRNSPLKCGKSPAQLLFGHSIRDNLPILPHKLVATAQRDLTKERLRAKDYDDRKGPTKQQTATFHQNQTVAVQDDQTKEWSLRGKIVREVAPRSYQVSLENGKLLRRNRTFIRRLHPVSIPRENTQNQEPLTEAESIDGNENVTGSEGFVVAQGCKYSSFVRRIQKENTNRL